MHTPEAVYTAWSHWIAAFDQSVIDDQWDRLADYLSEDVVYRVTGAPFDCQLRGRDAVIAGFARSVRNFDRRFAQREWSPIGIRIDSSGYVRCHIHSAYHLADGQAIAFEATGHWGFRDGRIDLMLDFYDSGHYDVQQALAALQQMGDAFDPRYTD